MAAENSGGRVNYYLVEVKNPQRENQRPYQAECEDIIHALGMTFDEGNIFKEVWRQAAARQGRAKEGNTALRGAQKLVHYANRILRHLTMASPADGWIEWDGKKTFPDQLPGPNTGVYYITRDGKRHGPILASELMWQYSQVPFEDAQILRFRIS
ncbi:hypothetical protein JJJA_0055 [Achromobacter phage JWDelta]|uniref:Uncharacterized protein n=1 Tax=Achromobacter phage JWDelta TaxID=1416008 RepID=V9SI61_9CAUD|nr:hypothetical protein JJJA_0055 [Achromobacter phage JWDelta]